MHQIQTSYVLRTFTQYTEIATPIAVSLYGVKNQANHLEWVSVEVKRKINISVP